MKSILVVVDMQNGFVNQTTEHILEPIQKLIRFAESTGTEVAFTRFINHSNSGWVKWIHWTRFMESPEIDLHPTLLPLANHVFDKSAYGAFTAEFAKYIADRGIERMFFCGIATDGCVLKSAVDAFERDIEPIVIQDACASHAGVEVHKAGLLLASRFLGKRQLIRMNDLLAAGFEALSYQSPEI